MLSDMTWYVLLQTQLCTCKHCKIVMEDKCDSYSLQKCKTESKTVHTCSLFIG
jgi:hypothetical protein